MPAAWPRSIARCTLPAWPALSRYRRLALAVWQGHEPERAGLKSVTPDWIDLEAAA